ncbi:MAG: general secretion pathway protein GspF, partial [Planctomycetaceae bacterium]|nr:general secretion pathway protein GspF [Planctomycetaceae bacterium]
LVGVGGALVWLTCTFGSVLAVFVLYQVIARSVSGKRMLDPLLIKIPVLGKCMRSFAIARFSWCLYLTQQTGMPIQNSMQASLRATANGAFQGASGLICQLVESGDDLSTALAASRLFPEEFLQMVMVAETSGTVPEALHRLSPQFEEDARRAMSTLAGALGVLVWVVVAAFILFFVFSIVLWYAGMLNEFADEALRG